MQESAQAMVAHRKRRRRRRQDKRAISARLALDDHVGGDVGILSEDLFADIFPHHVQKDHQEAGRSDAEELHPALAAAAHIHHVAIAPWTPDSSPETTNWTIVPVTKSTALAHSTVQFSPAALALQCFAADLERVAPSKLSGHGRSGIDILVLDVLPLPLDTVFVSLDRELAKRLEDGEGTFFREHPATPTGKAPSSPEARLADAVRAALGTLQVVHTGDLFPLPLAPHPVTHVPPNPGKVTLCEPVAQGILSPETKIIVSRGRSQPKGNRSAGARRPGKILNGVAEDDEDTANDQFYSAAEERYKTGANDTAEESAAATSDSESEPASSPEHDELSDDSMDDMISLQAPMLSATTASGFSTIQPGTPMTLGRGRRTNGIATPGSVFSSFTATTARPDRPRGRLFKALGLLRPIPSELLHPKPVPEDDEEAHVYVDVSSLSRIGCFSGDWVRVEASAGPPPNGFGPFALGSFGQPDDMEPNWRPARVFGLPEGYSKRPVTRIPSSKHTGGRRLSFFESQIQKQSSPPAYASPVLLANLDAPTHLRLLPLKRAPHHVGNGPPSQATSVVQPPYAREVIIQQLRTPVSSSRDVQVAVMAGLKWHFEKKLRVIKAGDLIAVPIDTQLGRTMHEASSLGEGSAVDDILSLAAGARELNRRSLQCDDVAWFKVAHVHAQKQDPVEPDQTEDLWGSAACVEASLTRVETSGSVTGRAPGTKDSTWPYYLGLARPPNRGPDAPPVAISEAPHRYVPALRRRLRELLAAATSKRALHLKMPPVAILLVSTQRNVGKATLATEACRDMGLHTFVLDAFDILNSEAGAGGGGDVKTDGSLRARAERALSCGPECCALLIRHVEALTADRMAASMRAILSDTRVLIATATEPEKIPDAIRGLFTHELEVAAPDEREREGILRAVVDRRGVALDPEVDLGGVALKTAALVAGDLVDVVDRALVARRARLERLSETKREAAAGGGNSPAIITVRDVQVAGGPSVRGLTRPDFEWAVDTARKNFADAIGAPKIPNVTWDDVGGLGGVKEAVTETIQLPLERPELFARGMKKRSGILFYGPPGTGKTLLAKAIATEYSLNFFSVKGPELLNMYIGESEANVRRVFQRARDARPCVVFFDELDSVAPKRGNQGDSGGVMDRIVSQLLAELDGMSSPGGGGGDDASGPSSGGGGSGGVFVIGATNRPDLLDPALLRPGRFDKLLYLGVSDTHDKQLKIMEALTRKFTLHPSVSLGAIAGKLPFTYTGADFYALCSDAMLKAVTRQASQVDAKIRAMNSSQQQQQQPQKKHEISTAYFFDHYATPEDIAVMVTEEDFMAAHRELIPSVSAGELAHYERVRASFEGGREKQQQQQSLSSQGSSNALVGLGSRTVSGSSTRSSGGGPAGGGGKGKPSGRDKGKGKALAFSSDEEDGDGVVNGKAVFKGKSRAVLSPTTSGPNGSGFGGAGTGDDDEGLYP